jgi:YkoY family integral membrane protein
MIAEILPALQEALPVIIALIVIEGLLSVDNILAIASLASQLPEHQRKLAVRLGLAGAYLYRGLALLFASYILEYEWVKFLGAFYLIHLMAEHFSDYAAETDGDPTTHAHAGRTFLGTIVAIQLMDLSLSVDNVIAAVAMSPKFWVVCTGVGLGLLTLWMFATISLKLVERFPILKHTAFLLIGYVGLILLVEMTAEYIYHQHMHITALQKFFGLAGIIVLSLWYARNAWVQKALDPALRVCLGPVKVYAAFAGGVIAIIAWPFKQVWSGVMRKPEPPDAAPGTVPVPVVADESVPPAAAGDAEGA